MAASQRPPPRQRARGGAAVAVGLRLLALLLLALANAAVGAAAQGEEQAGPPASAQPLRLPAPPPAVAPSSDDEQGGSSISIAAAPAVAAAAAASGGRFIVRLLNEPGDCQAAAVASSASAASLRQLGPAARARRLRSRYSRLRTGHVFRHLVRGFVVHVPAATAAATADDGAGGEAAAAELAAETASQAAAALRELVADPCLQVEPDRLAYASAAAAPLAAGDSLPVGVRRILAATDSSVHGPAGVGIALLDTGVDPTHPDLNVVGGANCVSSSQVAGCAPGAWADDHGHGTHVAGIAAARNNGRGVVGVAPGTPLFAVKVLAASGSGSFSDIIQGLEWVRAHNANVTSSAGSGANVRIRVVNLSLGSPASLEANVTRALPASCRGGSALHAAICRLTRDTANGAVVVAAAGNEASNLDSFIPAAYPEVLAVTAMADADGLPGAAASLPLYVCTQNAASADDKEAYFSNYVAAGSPGERHTVAAPGACVYSTYINGGYASLSGTSMAAPHVAGLAALCFGEPGAAAAAAGPQRGACAARFASTRGCGGGAAGVVRLLVANSAFRQAGAAGFVGDRSSCRGGAAPCNHYGFLVSAAAL